MIQNSKPGSRPGYAGFSARGGTRRHRSEAQPGKAGNGAQINKFLINPNLNPNPNLNLNLNSSLILNSEVLLDLFPLLISDPCK